MKERSFRENRRKGIIFLANAINEKGAKTFRCGVDFQKSPSSDFIWRGLLATSSLAVGPFAAKTGSLRSPRGRLVASLDVVQRFQSKLNEFNLTSRGERKGFALEKSAQFIDRL